MIVAVVMAPSWLSVIQTLGRYGPMGARASPPAYRQPHWSWSKPPRAARSS